MTLRSLAWQELANHESLVSADSGFLQEQVQSLLSDNGSMKERISLLERCDRLRGLIIVRSPAGSAPQHLVSPACTADTGTVRCRRRWSELSRACSVHSSSCY